MENAKGALPARREATLRPKVVREYVYRKFSGSTSARAHREPHHVDFKPSLICASSRTNFPLSLYPASLRLPRVYTRAHPRPRSLSLSLYTRVHAFSVFRTYTVPSPDFFPYLFVSSSFFPLLSFFFDRLGARCARPLRDLYRRMCRDNLVVIVLSLLVHSPSTRPFRAFSPR